VKATLRDPETLRSLPPLAIRRYLEVTGWHRNGSAAQASPCWTLRKGKSEYEVLVPTDPEFRDYPLRVAELLRTLETVEARPVLEIWHDLTLAGYDVVRVRVQPAGREAGSIPLEQGIAVVQATRDLLLAAASAAVEPRLAFPTRKPGKATEFMQRVRLAAPERGSFVVTALSPVPPSLQPDTQGQASLDLAEPFEREVSLKLMDALTALRQAALAESEAAFAEAVRFGVSANLCSAVAEMATAGDAGVEVALSWARTRPVPAAKPRRVQIPDRLVPVIREAARLFRDRSPVEEFELIGPVIRLERPDGAEVGSVTVLGFAEGIPRRVTLSVGREAYDVAIQAHRDGQPVGCSGVLQRVGTAFRLDGVRGFGVAEVA